MKGIVFCLFDGSGYFGLPWANAGYQVKCFNYDDADHGNYKAVRVEHPNIEYVNAWIDGNLLTDLMFEKYGKPCFIASFAPCTDLANSGSRHWAKKREANPTFQQEAATACRIAAELGDWFKVPYMVENPVGKLSTLWRKPDHIFNPCDFGGYLDENDAHPAFPDIIPARDAYNKKTCLWTGNGFVMPEKKALEPYGNDNPGWKNLGGKSARTKLIRSLTPRGLARAIFEANAK